VVAFTPTYALPYQQGTDPPCFGPGAGCTHLNSVWCDFANLVEAQMDVFDGFVGRTATAIPMAKISFTRTADTLFSDFVDRLPFDTVVYDTDDMVDFAVSPSAIVPKRNGVYLINFLCFFEQPGADQLIEFQIETASEEEPSDGGGTNTTIATGTTRGLAVGPLSHFLRASSQYLFTDVTTPRAITVSNNQGPYSPPQTSFASLEVFWHSDL